MKRKAFGDTSQIIEWTHTQLVAIFVIVDSLTKSLRTAFVTFTFDDEEIALDQTGH